MRTRTDEESDFAADVSIFAEQIDPATGGRRLEDLVGEAKGRMEADREAILRMLSRRGFVLSQAIRTRIAQESDLAQLARWLDTAITADSIDDLFCDQALK